MIKKITNFPRIIEMSAINFEPHRMAFYLQDLSAEFHSLWNKGVENPELKFIIKNDFKCDYISNCCHKKLQIKLINLLIIIPNMFMYHQVNLLNKLLLVLLL